MAAEHRDQARLVGHEPPEPVLGLDPRIAIDFHHGLIETQARRAPGLRQPDIVLMEIRIPGIEQPAGAGLHGNAGVARGVPGQWDQKYVGSEVDEVAHAPESHPGIAAGSILVPGGRVLPLRGAIAPAADEAARRRRGASLGRQHVNRGRREVADTAGMVEIEVREHNVAHVRGVDWIEGHLRDVTLAYLRKEEREHASA